MKAQKFIKVKYLLVLLLAFYLTNCEEQVSTPVFSELSPASIQSEGGVQGVLNSAYNNIQLSAQAERFYHWGSGLPAGLTWNVGGQVEAFFSPLSNFTWSSTHVQIDGFWDQHFAAVRDANIVISTLENGNFSNEFKQAKTAEAKFIRGWSYYLLYINFGRLPLFRSPEDDPLKPRASEEETMAFIEQNLKDAAEILPVTQDKFGKATKGAAWAVLTKFYLNTKQWQKTADMAQQIIDMGKYGLMESYTELHAIENEGNKEMIWVLVQVAPEAPQAVNALTFPTDFPFPNPNNAAWAAKTWLFDDFVNSFEENDERRDVMVFGYESTDTGEFILGLGNDKTLPLKYPWDPNANGQQAGNDIIGVRYADILLSRAEALNELNGPTQEAIDLINQVRERAKLSTLNVGDFTQESLRNRILTEREHEFFREGQKVIHDQIRHGVFIERAQARGKVAAQPFHRLFPIPQTDIDANPNLEQNPGY